jgi:hypothetical protein
MSRIIAIATLVTDKVTDGGSHIPASEWGAVMYMHDNGGLVLEMPGASYDECECLPGEAVPERPLDPGFMSDRDWRQHFESNPHLYPPVRDID